MSDLERELELARSRIDHLEMENKDLSTENRKLFDKIYNLRSIIDGLRKDIEALRRGPIGRGM